MGNIKYSIRNIFLATAQLLRVQHCFVTERMIHLIKNDSTKRMPYRDSVLNAIQLVIS